MRQKLVAEYTNRSQFSCSSPPSRTKSTSLSHASPSYPQTTIFQQSPFLSHPPCSLHSPSPHHHLRSNHRRTPFSHPLQRTFPPPDFAQAHSACHRIVSLTSYTASPPETLDAPHRTEKLSSELDYLNKDSEYTCGNAKEISKWIERYGSFLCAMKQFAQITANDATALSCKQTLRLRLSVEILLSVPFKI